MASETREATIDERIAALDGAVNRDPSKQWWLYRRVLPTGLVLFVMELFGGDMRIGLGKSDRASDGFCTVLDYANTRLGWRAALGWNGEGDPEGWVRRVDMGAGTARRRPDGTPESEYCAP